MNRLHGENTAGSAPAGSPAISTGYNAAEQVPRYSAHATEEEINRFSRIHEYDPNMSKERVDTTDTIDSEKQAGAITIIHEDHEASAYPEVDAATEPTDDPSLPAGTFRAWFLGLLFVTIGSGLNLIFSLRDPSISVGPLVAQLCSYPCGVFMAWALPKREWNLFGYRFSLNPGPFNKKEHTIIVIMANVTFASGASYAALTIEAQRGFYKMDKGFGFAILFTLATQMTGLGLAGMFRKYLVYPASMIWPGILPNAALFHTLHDGVVQLDPAATSGWKIPRFRFFLYVLLGGFIWYWFPGFLWTGLSNFAWVTWLRPKNILVNQLFGGFSGYSFGAPFTVFTLDWTYLNSYVGSPLVVPWNAILNTMIGLVVFTWAVSSAIFFSGGWYSDYLPVSTGGSFDNTGHKYQVKNILTPQYTLDMAKYKSYSPIYLSTTFALQYGLSFASISAVLVHTWLFHGPEIWSRFRQAKNHPKDIHMRMMESYKEVPQWWFLVMLAIMMGIGLGSTLPYDMQLPAWGYFLAIGMSAFFLLPIGIITAITNIGIGLNVVTEFVIAYMLPGRPMAMMAFKTLGYITCNQAVSYAGDQKLAIYMKVPYRTIFWAQLWGTALGSFVQIGALTFMFSSIPDLCADEQKNKFTCPNGRVFFNASIIWGVIGPQRMFGNGSVYTSLQWFWLAGAAAPFLLWLILKKFPRSPLRILHLPIIFGGTGQIPPAVPMNYLMWGMIGWLFNSAIRSRARGWWLSYNYILSASLDAGLALATILIFFALTMNKIDPPEWWGNTVVESTLDFQKKAVRKTIPKDSGGTFGPPPGSW